MQSAISDTVKVTSKNTGANLTPINHVFEQHLLQVNSPKPIVRENNENYWSAVVLMLGLSLMVLIRVTSPKKFFILLRAFFSFNAAKQLLREDYRLNKGSSLILIALFLINFPFLILKLNSYYHFFSYPFSDLICYLLLLLTTALFYTIKIVLLKILGTLVKNQATTDEYVYFTFLSVKGVGIFIYPALIFLQYSQLPALGLMSFGLLVCLLFYSVRVVRGALILINSGDVSLFHLFLYLCALEIIPLIVIIKILVSGILVFG